MKRRLLLAFLALALLMTGCVRNEKPLVDGTPTAPVAEILPTEAVQPDSPTPSQDNSAAIAETPVSEEPTTTTIPLPDSVPVELSLGSLWLKITAPPDNGIISVPFVDVVGQAVEGTVLTINDDILLIGSDQTFRSTIQLETGPNIIEVLASNENGEELYYFLTVYFEPEMTPEG